MIVIEYISTYTKYMEMTFTGFQFVFNPNYRFYGEITVVGNNEIVISE